MILAGRYLFVLFIAVLSGLPLTAQRMLAARIDSLNMQAEQLRYIATDSAAVLARQALKLSEKTALRKQKVMALVNWSYVLAESGALDSAAILADSARVNAIGIADSSVRSAVLVLQGYICDYSENNAEALRYYFEGLAMCPDLKHRAAILNNIGGVYKLLQDLHNANKYYEQSYAIGVQLGDSIRQAKCLNNLGGVSYSNNDFPNALRRYNRSLQIREALHDSSGIAICYSNIAMVYEKLNRPDSALMLYRRAQDVSRLSNHPLDMIVYAMNAGNVLFEMNRQEEAFHELQLAAALADSLHFHYYSRLAHRSLANYYAKTGDYRAAYDHYVKYAAYNDTVQTDRLQKNTQELELRYRTRESAQQILLLSEQQKAALLENENKENRLGRQRNWLVLVLLISLVIVLGALLLLQRYRAERKLAAQLQQLVGEKDLLLREIHHRVKNNLQLVSSLLSLQEDTGGKESLRQNQERIHTLSLLHEQLYRSTDLKAISFREYVETLVAHIARSFTQHDADIQVRCAIDDGVFDIDQLVPCGLIINELATNAFKYAFPDGTGTLTVSMTRDGDQCTLIVADDGIGMSEPLTAARETLGLRLVQGLTRQLRGTVQFSGAPGKGTSCCIIFAVKPKENSAVA
jgi:two-component sensor histidine kinase